MLLKAFEHFAYRSPEISHSYVFICPAIGQFDTPGRFPFKKLRLLSAPMGLDGPTLRIFVMFPLLSARYAKV